MKISNFQSEQTTQGLKFSADVSWEDSNFPKATLYISSPAFADEYFPYAFFLLSMLPSALRRGETRVEVDGDIELALLENVPIALSNLSAWFYDHRKIPDIEVLGKVTTPKPIGEGCGMTLSGGVDSLSLVLHNRSTFNREHPLSITHAFFVNGMDINIPNKGEEQTDFFWKSFESMRGFCRKKDVELLPVFTNLRDSHLARCDWGEMHHGMALAGILQSFSHLISNGFIAGGCQASQVSPFGSHPLVDPFCGGYTVKVHHALSHLTRFQRAQIVAVDLDALSCLRVCWLNITNDGPLNCSHCHKCVITMLELLANGKLAQCPTFAVDDVTPELAESALRNNTPSSLPFFRDLVEPLRDIGREDLFVVIVRKIKAIERVERRRDALIYKVVRRIWRIWA